MIRLTFIQNDGVPLEVEAYAGVSVMESAAMAGVLGIDAICGGSCICGTCQIFLDADTFAEVGGPGEDETAVLEGTGVSQPTSRLACQIKVSESLDGKTITVAPPRK